MPRTEQPKRATVFNGTSAFINCGDVCNFSTNFSMSAWINVTTAGHCLIVSRRNGVITQLGFGVHANQNLTVYTDSAVGQSSTNLILGQWYHVVVVWGDPGEVTLYINGALDSTHTLTQVTPAASDLNIGRRALAGDNWFPGRLFDLQIFSQALSAGQASELYTKGSQALRGVSRELWLKLDSLGTAIAHDSSGNARHGTPANITYGEFSAIPFSYQNDSGYTLSSGVYIPRNEANKTLDAAGNPLQYSGPLPRVTQGNPVAYPRDLSRINVKEYGAVGDGVADDYAIVNQLLTLAQTTGKTLYFPDGTYRLSATLARNTANSNSLTTDLAIEFAQNAQITSTVRILDLEGAATARTVAADIENGVNTITLADASGLASGDTIFLESTVVGEYTWNYVARETHKIRSVSGNVVTLYTRIRFAYTLAEIAVCRTRKNLTLRLDGYHTLSTGGVARQENIVLGMRVLCRHMDLETNVANNWAFILRESIGSQFRDSKLTGHTFGLNFDFCGECNSDGMDATNAGQVHLANFWSRNCIFRNAKAVNCTDVIDGHPSFDCKYEHCHAVNCTALGSPRGLGITVSDCTLRTTTAIAQHFFGPPTPNVTSPSNGGINVTRFPWLSDHQVSLDGVHLIGPSAQSGLPGINVNGNATRVMISDCVAPALYIECPGSTATVCVSNCEFGVFWNRHAGRTQTSNMTIKKSLLGFLDYAMMHTFVTVTQHSNLRTVGFDALTDYLYNNLSQSPTSQYLFTNCDLRGFLDWNKLALTNPTVQLSNSIVGITNNSTSMPLTKFSNNTGTFGVSL
jgi:hypothetical protein